MAAGGGAARRCWRSGTGLARAVRGVCGSGRATAALRAEELAERLRKSDEQQREPGSRAEGLQPLEQLRGLLWAPPAAPAPSCAGTPELKAALQIPKDPTQRWLRELAAMSQQLQQVHPNVLAKILKQRTLYQNEEIVVIDKPYGLPVHGGPGIKNCIADVLPILAKMLENMKAEPLHLCHRLDKETTGVMVLARSKEAAEKIRLLFKTRQVEKIYWAIVLGDPDPVEGVVEIPIVEKEVKSHQSHYKMTLAPRYRVCAEDGRVVKARGDRHAERAVTRYRRLAAASACSLLQLQPITGVKHQIRVHLAYGLGCPILGDHKYSHWSKLAPQKLPELTLRRLKLEQSKARHLPLHLHAHRLCLPLGQPLDFVCKVPPFFQKTLRKLELDIPKD